MLHAVHNNPSWLGCGFRHLRFQSNLSQALRKRELWQTIKEVHTRRIATFLLGAWISCSLFMAFIAIQNLRSPGAVMSAPIEPRGKVIQKFGAGQGGFVVADLARQKEPPLFLPVGTSANPPRS